MAGEMDRKELAELLCQVFFYDEDFLRTFDVGAKGFSREWREQTQVQVDGTILFVSENASVTGKNTTDVTYDILDEEAQPAYIVYK